MTLNTSLLLAVVKWLTFTEAGTVQPFDLVHIHKLCKIGDPNQYQVQFILLKKGHIVVLNLVIQNFQIYRDILFSSDKYRKTWNL